MNRTLRTIAVLLIAPACGAPAQSQAAPAPIASATRAAPPSAQASSAPAGAPEIPAPPAVAIPDTPAAHVLQAWLEAFNSGDQARIAAYVTKYKDVIPADQMVAFRQDTGGFDPLAVQSHDRLRIMFRVREKASPTVAVGILRVTDTNPPTIDREELGATPPGTTADMVVQLDAAARTRVIDGIVAKLSEYYVVPDVAKKMETALRAHQKNGDYDAIGDGDDFSFLLTEHLQAVSNDKHLRVRCYPTVTPPDPPADPHPPDPEQRAQLERINCGFDKAERLDGNIGYVKFDMFAEPAICAPKATAAMEALGDPEMVAFIASYLFKKRTHLNDIYERKGNKTTQYWTKPDVPGPRFADTPAFVLTSRRTFSGAEEFAYDLKNLKRATLVGETTGGGAHPTWRRRVDDHFAVLVPFARAINPISKTDWEGTGVEPDVKVPADQALDVAKTLAAEKIAKSAKPRP